MCLLFDKPHKKVPYDRRVVRVLVLPKANEYKTMLPWCSWTPRVVIQCGAKVRRSQRLRVNVMRIFEALRLLVGN